MRLAVHLNTLMIVGALLGVGLLHPAYLDGIIVACCWIATRWADQPNGLMIGNKHPDYQPPA